LTTDLKKHKARDTVDFFTKRFVVITADQRCLVETQVLAIQADVLADRHEPVLAWADKASRRAIREAFCLMSGKVRSDKHVVSQLGKRLQNDNLLSLAQKVRMNRGAELEAQLKQPVDPYDANWALEVALGKGDEACVMALIPHADLYHPQALLKNSLHADRAFSVVFIEAFRRRLPEPTGGFDVPELLRLAARKNRWDLVENWQQQGWAPARLGETLANQMLSGALDNGHALLAWQLMETQEASASGLASDTSEKALACLDLALTIGAAQQRARRAGESPQRLNLRSPRARA
jgi:hypothetical protein